MTSYIFNLPVFQTNFFIERQFYYYILKGGVQRRQFSASFLGKKQFKKSLSPVPINLNVNLELNPEFVTGFTDGEGCFHVAITENKELNLGWKVELLYTIGLHIKDRPLLEDVQDFFGVGYIAKYKLLSNQFRVSKLKDLEVVIHHFNKLPLISQKFADYELWKKVYNLMLLKQHLTANGLRQILAIKASMNLSLSYKLTKAFPDVVPVVRPIIQNKQFTDPQWLAGFTSAEGSFQVNIQKSLTKLGQTVNLEFSIAQHERDSELLIMLIKYFQCGYIKKDKTGKRNLIEFRITRLKDLTEKVIPLFLKHQIRGGGALKKKDFEDFCLVAEMMNNKLHLTPLSVSGGLAQIKTMKAGNEYWKKI